MTLAYKRLTDALESGALTSGTLLSIPLLAEQFDMSLSPIRDAVKRAESAGLIEVLPKRGFMVMDCSVTKIRDCLDLRAIFDAEGARRMIDMANTAALTQLRADHAELRDRALDGNTPDIQRRALDVDLSLHDALAAALQSELAQDLYTDNRHRISIIQNQRPFLSARVVSAMEEHLRIIDAIEAGQADVAMCAIQQHLDKTLEWWGAGR